MFQACTVELSCEEEFGKQFVMDVNGAIRIQAGKSFGFIGEVYVHPSLVSKNNLIDSQEINGKAIKTYNKDKKSWGWKLFLV